MMHPDVSGQIGELEEAIGRFRPWAGTLAEWGERLAEVLTRGGRLLTCGNGGSAAMAQHLAAELVGRFQSERRPLSAIALSADTAALTAIGNDYDFDQIFARQVVAHGRPGDVLVLLSTSGMSTNVLTAANVAKAYAITTWALTGRGPNPLASACHDAVTVEADQTATVQEIHLLAVHLLSAAVDQALGVEVPPRTAVPQLQAPGQQPPEESGSAGHETVAEAQPSASPEPEPQPAVRPERQPQPAVQREPRTRPSAKKLAEPGRGAGMAPAADAIIPARRIRPGPDSVPGTGARAIERRPGSHASRTDKPVVLPARDRSAGGRPRRRPGRRLPEQAPNSREAAT
jgi:D-sedoheptulose 7-phosphate isomerase